jgi:PKD repeat protein
MRRLTIVVIVLSGLFTFDMAVAQTNPPVLDAIGARSVNEGSLLEIRVTATDLDAGDVITLAAELLPANAAFNDSTGGVGGFSFQPDFTQAGNHQVRFIASDAGGLADTEMVDITVDNIDRAPTIASVTPQNVNEGALLNIRITATDPDIGDIISLVVEQLPSNATFSDSSGGLGGIVFNPDFTQSGSYQVRIIANSNALVDTEFVSIDVANVDRAPILSLIGPQSVAENSHLDVRVSASDPDGDGLVLTAEQIPVNAAFVDSGSGIGGFSFDPDFTQAGNFQVRFIVSANSLADTELVSVTVTNVDRAPAITPVATQNIAEGGRLNIRLAASDPDGDGITLSAQNLPSNATFSDSGSGVGGIVFDPDFNQAGSYQVSIIAVSNALADTELVNINVSDTDRAPVLAPIGARSVAEGGHLEFRISASDPDGDALTLAAQQLPSNASFNDSSGGVGGFLFDPDFSQSGSYQVRFIVLSNTLADTELVQITVTEFDRPPVLTAIPPQVVNEGAVLNVRVASTDPDGNAITLTAQNLPANATFADSSGGIGGLVFSPNFTQAGNYQVRIIASSLALADTELVDITVNNTDRAPVLTAIPPQVVNEGAVLNVRVASTDPDGNAITLTAQNLPANATFADSSGGIGGLVFSPNFTQAGNYQVRIIASSLALADTELVDITVNNTDRAPVITTIPPQVVNEGAVLNVRVASTDPDGNTITLTAQNLPANATFADSSGGIGGLVFSPNFTQAGNYQVRIIAASLALADTELVNITVTEIDRAPVLTAIPPQVVNEGAVLNVRVASTDPDGNTITLTAQNLPANATFADSSGGIGGLVFSPNFTQSGNYQVRIIAASLALADTELVNITVTEIDRPPVITAIPPQVVNEGAVLNVRVASTDPDGNAITLTAQNLPTNATFADSSGGIGGLVFSPNFIQAGNYQVRIIASSLALADTELVDITVSEFDRPPVITAIPPQVVNEGAVLNVRVASTDPDGNVITLTAQNLPTNATFADSSGGIGGLVFSPNFTQAGNYQVRIIAASLALADTELVNITVTEFDRPPVISSIPPQVVNEGAVLNVRVASTDPDGNTITLTAQNLPANATFADSSGGIGGLVFSPNFTQAGNYQVRIIASSLALADTELVNITVTEIDRPPVLTAIPPQVVNEGAVLNVRLASTDPDGNTITLTAQNLPANATFADSSGGIGGLVFSPNFTQAGNYQVRIIAVSLALADTELVDITVNNTDRAPVIASVPPQTVAETGHLAVRITASDPDGSTITMLAQNLPANASFTDSTGGVGGIVFDPNFSQSGNYQVRVIANAGALADTELVSITVTETDRPPVLASVPPQSINEGAILRVRVSATDPDGNVITLTAQNLPANASFSDSTGGIGGLTFSPDFTQAGAHQVRIIASSLALTDTEFVNITVNNVDRGPIITPITPRVVSEGGNLQVRITASDPDGDGIILAAQLLPLNASFVDSTGGVGGLVFNPNFTQAGNYQIRIIAIANALIDTEFVGITVVNVDLPPVLATIGPRSVAEGGHLQFRVTASDPDGNAIGLLAQQMPINSSFTDSTGGVGGFVFDPSFAQGGVYQVRFIASSNALSDTEVVTITVTENDRPPVIAAVSPQTIAEGGHLAVRISATDPDAGNIITLLASSLPANATFADSTGGVGGLVFDPNFTQAGLYQVRIIAMANALADTEFISITVTNVDRAPVLASIGPRSVMEGGHLEFRVTASDADGEAITLVAQDLPTNAAFTDSTGGRGGFIFNPNFTQSGNYQVRFIANANSQSDTELVTITVTEFDRQPVIAAVAPQTVPEAGHLTVRISASDPDGDVITLSAQNLPANASFVDSSGGIGGLVFDPNFTQAGPFQVRIIAAANAMADTELVNITVTNVDRAPVLAAIGPRSVNEGAHLEFRVSATDPDGEVITLIAQQVPANASFADSSGGIGGFVFNPNFTQAGNYQVRFIASASTMADTELVTITVNNIDRAPVLATIPPQTVSEGGHLALRINASDSDNDAITLTAENLPLNASFVDSTGGLGRLTFDPEFGQTGNYQVRIIAAANGQADSQMVDITVVEFDRAPVITTVPPQVVNEGGHLAVRISSSDPDGDVITLSAQNLPANATFSDSTNGIGGLVFDPDFTQAGAYQVRIIANSNSLADTELVNITVNNVDRAPILSSIPPQVVDEGGNLRVRVAATDPDGNTIILTAQNLPTNATFADSTGGVGGLVFNPSFTQAGAFQVRIIASANALADTELVNITVNNIDRAPVLATIGPRSVAEGGHLAVRVTASDPDIDIITVIAQNLPTNASFVDSTGGVGGFVFDPNFSQEGNYQVRFIASSNALSDTELVTITVTGNDRPPVVTAVPPQTVNEGAALTVRVTATDPDAGDIIALSAINLPANAAFADSSGGVGGLVFNPAFNQSGVYQVGIIAIANALADTELVQITVVNIDRPPVMTAIPPQFAVEGGHLEFRVSATDPDGGAIALVAQNMPANAAFTDSTGGRGGFVFNPDFTQAGNYQVRFIANSGTLADTELVNIAVTEFDLPPILAPIGPRSIAEGGLLNIRVTATDPDGNVITLVAEQIPANAAFTDSSNGIGGFTFAPNYTQAGSFPVRFIARSLGMADTELVTITVNNTDRAPVFANVPPQSIPEGQTLNFSVSATDADGDLIALTTGTLPANASFADLGGGNGQFTFNPDLAQEGHYDIAFYAASNSPAMRDTLVVGIDVGHINSAPILSPIGPRSVNENQTLSFVITSSDIDGQIPALTAFNLPTNASFVDSLNGHGRFVFTPTFFQAGPYTVLFVATDGTLSDSESVTITVNDVNRPPVLATIGNRSVLEGGTLSFRLSSTDLDLQTPVLTAVNIPINATLVDSTNGAGSFRFRPDFTQSGIYFVTFIASDGIAADSEIVRITVLEAGNQPPVIDPIGPQVVTEGQSLTLLITANDADSTVPVIQGFNLPANSIFADSGDGRAQFTFNPNFTQAGIYNVLFRAYDGSLYDSLWVQVTVNDFGFPPVLNPIGPRVIAEGQTLQFVVTSTDPDGTFPQLSASPLPANAVLTDSLNGHGLFSFTPNFTQSGIYNILFVCSDGLLADSEMVQITVNDFGNVAPVLAPIGTRTVFEADSLIFTVTASDPDGSTPTLAATNLPTNATFADNGNGTGRFAFYPTYFQAGIFNVLFIASDGMLTDSEMVQIAVINVNRPPVLASIGPQTVSEGGILQVRIASTDPDGTIPILSTGALPANAIFSDSLNGAGLFDFRPDFTQQGIFNVLFVAADGAAADSELVQVTVTGTNQPPVFDPLGSQFIFENDTLTFAVHAVDPDGGIPTLTAQNLMLHATFVDNGGGNGTFRYEPDFTQAGVDTVTFTANDGQSSGVLNVQITTVDVGNQRPVLASIGPRSVNEGQHLQFDISASDPDGVPPQLVTVNMPANAAFTDFGNGTGTFTFDPDYAQAGFDTVLFIATDGGLADSEYVRITINNINQRPIVATIGPRTINENDSLAIPISASDPDGQFVFLTASPLAAHMAFTDNGNGAGSFGFRPDFTQSGVYDILFVASDSVLADTETVRITVLEAGNQAPVLAPVDTAYFVTEGGTLQLPISATDADLTPLILSAGPLAPNMTFIDNANGTGLFTFIPNFQQSGNYPVTFRVFDGLVFDSASTRIYVAEQGNQYPILTPIGPRAVAEGGSLIVDISAADPEGFTTLLFTDNLPAFATFIDNGNGTGRFTYNPNYYSAGIDTVRFIAMDVGGLIDYEDVLITVFDVNQAPSIAYQGDTLVAEGGTLIATVIVFDSTDFQPGTISLTHGYMPPNSAFMITGNGVGQFIFTPAYNQSGVDSAYFVAVDSDSPPMSANRWVRLRVTGTNRRPVLQQPPPSEIDQGDTLVLDILATDPDGDPITLYINSNNYPLIPPNSEFQDLGGGRGQFIFRPDYTQSGLFIIGFGATDGRLIDTKSALIQVRDLGNQHPTLYPIGSRTLTEGETLNLHIRSSDPDSTRPALAASGALPNMVFTDSTNGAGSLIFESLYFQAGVYNLTFSASDGQYADSELVTITVLEAGNQAPNLALISDRTVLEGQILRFSVSANDPDSTIPRLVARNLPTGATFTDSLNGRGGFAFTPTFTQSGVYQVRFVAIDNINPALADSQNVQITVTDFNNWPTIEPISPRTVNEGEILAFTVVAHDIDGTTPWLAANRLPPNASFTYNGDGTGSFVFMPSFFQAGIDSARFIATDAVDPTLFAVMSVRITTVNINRPPVMQPIADTTIPDGFLLTINILASDPDSISPILFVRGRPDSAVFIDNGNGTGQFRWRPRFQDIGTYNVIFGCRDRSFQTVSDSQLVIISVITAGNHPPAFVQIPDQSLGDGDTLLLNVASVDIDGDPLVISTVGALPFGMQFSDLGGGLARLFWIPTEAQEGDTSVTLVVRDAAGLTDTMQIGITVVTFVRGDANGSGTLNGIDVVFLVAFFKGIGPPPDPMMAGDANGNGQVNGLDVIYLVAYFKGSGPPPPPMPPGGGPESGPRLILPRTASGMGK